MLWARAHVHPEDDLTGPITKGNVDKPKLSLVRCDRLVVCLRVRTMGVRAREYENEREGGRECQGGREGEIVVVRVHECVCVC